MKQFLIFVFAFLALIACGNDNNGDDNTKTPSLDDQLNDFFVNEVKPVQSAACFQGAYYRKAVSSKDSWIGIGGTVVLPQIIFDEDRKNPAKPGQYLDNPSIYMGGNSGGQETDIGMTWEVVKDDNGNVSADRRAFRPFLRRTALGSQSANYSNAPAQKEYYWYPGEEITMTLQVVGNGVVRFIVEGAGKKFEQDYECAGYKVGTIAEYKRVNAIDQVSNEGKPAQATKTKVTGGAWKETYLYRNYNVNGQVTSLKVPMHTGRFTDMRCPESKHFTITTASKPGSSESIDIDGSPK